MLEINDSHSYFNLSIEKTEKIEIVLMDCDNSHPTSKLVCRTKSTIRLRVLGDPESVVLGLSDRSCSSFLKVVTI